MAVATNTRRIERPGWQAWAGIATLGLVWGGAFMGIKLALDGFGPVTVAAGRLLFGALTLIAVQAFRGGLLSSWPKDGMVRWPFLAVMSVFGAAIPFFLLSWGQTQVSSGFAGVSMASVALFVLPLAHLLVPGDRLDKRAVAGFGLGFLGVVVLFAPQFDGADGSLAGRAACVAAAACYAVSSIATRLVPEMDMIALATWQTLVAAMLMVPAAILVEGPPPASPPTGAFIALLVLAILPTALANLIRVRVIRTAGPSFMSLVNFQVPVWAVVFGISVLGEPVSPNLFAALALILGGMAVSQWPSIRRVLR